MTLYRICSSISRFYHTSIKCINRERDGWKQCDKCGDVKINNIFDALEKYKICSDAEKPTREQMIFAIIKRPEGARDRK